MSDEHHSFITARHADNIVEAVRTLNATIAAERVERTRQHQQMLAVLQRIADHTENLPALMEVLMSQKANGDIHTVADGK